MKPEEVKNEKQEQQLNEEELEQTAGGYKLWLNLQYPKTK